MKNKLYTQPFEHYKSEPKDHSNLIIGIALGILFSFCAGVLWLTSVLEALSY